MGIKNGCGREDCGSSTGLCESPTFGRGTLDFNGYWQFPCGPCARAFEREHPKYGSCWPPPDNDLETST